MIASPLSAPILFARVALLALTLPGSAGATGLDCTFTTLCSPQTGCQQSAGVPFSFVLVAGALALPMPEGPIRGTPLAHVAPPAIGALFATPAGGTVLLHVTGSGRAVMVQTDPLPGDRLQSVSYFGTCAPAT